MNPAQAETLALKALTFLVQSPQEVERFLALSGIAPADLRARAADPEILAAVLDFLLADDARVTGFCEAEGVEPRLLHLARLALPGA